MPDLIKVAKKREESKEKDFELFNLDEWDNLEHKWRGQKEEQIVLVEDRRWTLTLRSHHKVSFQHAWRYFYTWRLLKSMPKLGKLRKNTNRHICTFP